MDLLGSGLEQLTVRCPPRVRISGLGLFDRGQDDDLVLARRAQPVPNSLPDHPVRASTGPVPAPQHHSVLAEDADSLEPLPRLCSWGTACGSTISRQCSLSSVSVHSPLATLRMRMWKPLGTRSPTSSRASCEGSPCGQRWSPLGPMSRRHMSFLGAGVTQSLPITSHPVSLMGLSRRHTPTTPLGCQRLASLSATDLQEMGNAEDNSTASTNNTDLYNPFLAYQQRPRSNPNPFTPTTSSPPPHIAPILDLSAGLPSGNNRTARSGVLHHHTRSGSMGSYPLAPTLQPSTNTASDAHPAFTSPFQAFTVQTSAAPPELDISSVLDTWPASAPTDSVPSTPRAPHTTDINHGLAFLSPIRPVQTPASLIDSPVQVQHHNIPASNRFATGTIAIDELFLDLCPTDNIRPMPERISAPRPARQRDSLVLTPTRFNLELGSPIDKRAQGDLWFPLGSPDWLEDGTEDVDTEGCHGIGEALQMSWVDWGALDSGSECDIFDTSADCSGVDTNVSSMEVLSLCDCATDGQAYVAVVPCLVHRGSADLADE